MVGAKNICSAQVLLLIGTKKGVFIGRADEDRKDWRFAGPHISGTWSFCEVRYDPTVRTIYAGGQSNWYGPAVWWSTDFGETWDHSSEGLTLGEGEPGLEQIWCVQPSNGALYAGADPASLFRSDDGGRTWRHLPALRAHPSSSTWSPTNGGLPLHAIRPHAQDAASMWVAVSRGGVYHTADAGETWEQCGSAEDTCVHALVGTAEVAEPGRTTLYQQNHAGVFRSDDGGVSWRDVSPGIPSLSGRFGFPLVAHPRRPETIYAVPLESETEGKRHVPDGRAAIWRTRDGGAHWESLTEGLPDGRTYMSVLRGGLAVDTLDPVGIYAGTPTGQLYASADEGETWTCIARALPSIYSVSCAVV